MVLTDPVLGIKGTIDKANELAKIILNSFMPLQVFLKLIFKKLFLVWQPCQSTNSLFNYRSGNFSPNWWSNRCLCFWYWDWWNGLKFNKNLFNLFRWLGLVVISERGSLNFLLVFNTFSIKIYFLALRCWANRKCCFEWRTAWSTQNSRFSSTKYF